MIKGERNVAERGEVGGEGEVEEFFGVLKVEFRKGFRGVDVWVLFYRFFVLSWVLESSSDEESSVFLRIFDLWFTD